MNQLSLFNHECSHGVKWRLEIDGASRGNPGLSGAGIHILREELEYLKRGYFLGTRTNNQAEYEALILGLCIIRPLIQEHDFVEIISDSELLVRQVSGRYDVKNSVLRQLHQRVRELLYGIKSSVAHVARRENSVADALANEGIDKRIVIPEDLKIQCALS